MNNDHYIRQGDPQYDTNALDDLYHYLLFDDRFGEAVRATERATRTSIEYDGFACDVDHELHEIEVRVKLLDLRIMIGEHESSHAALLQLANVYRVLAIELERRAGVRVEPESDKFQMGWLAFWR